jgi:hypothetical protein
MNSTTRDVIFSGISGKVILIGVFSAYIAVLLTSVQFHEMWRDEIQPWLIARDSDNIYELVYNLRYDGHPILWYLILMPLSRLTANPVAMQVAQVAIASTTVFIVFLYSPFSMVEKVILPFGYYTLFEYGIKCRNYSLGLLLVVILCAVWERRRTNKPLIAVILAALANVHVVFGIISLGFFAAIVVESIVQQTHCNRDFLWIIIYGLGWVTAAIVALPASDSPENEWILSLSLDRLYAAFNRLSFILASEQPFYAIGGAIVCIVVGFSLRKNLPIALFFSLSLIGLLAFSYMVKRGGGIWQHGSMFTTLLAAMWLNHATVDTDRTGAWRYDFFLAKSAFLLVLLVQSIFGLKITWEDFSTPYSNGRAVADFIREHGWEKQPIIGMRNDLDLPVVGYLAVERAFYANAYRWGSFGVWNTKQAYSPLSQPEIKRVLEVVDRWGCGLTLLTDPGGDSNEFSEHGWKRVAQFTGAMVGDENYLVYRKPCP